MCEIVGGFEGKFADFQSIILCIIYDFIIRFNTLFIKNMFIVLNNSGVTSKNINIVFKYYKPFFSLINNTSELA